MVAYEETLCQGCHDFYVYRPGYESHEFCPACLYRRDRDVDRLEEELARARGIAGQMETERDDLEVERDQLEGQVETLNAKLEDAVSRMPLCAHCKDVAVCIGVYEDPENPPAYACDSCCGHGNEDGWCVPLPTAA